MNGQSLNPPILYRNFRGGGTGPVATRPALVLIQAEFFLNLIRTRARRALNQGRYENHELALVTTKVLGRVERNQGIGRNVRRQLIVVCATVVGDQPADRRALAAAYVECRLNLTARGQRTLARIRNQTLHREVHRQFD